MSSPTSILQKIVMAGISAFVLAGCASAPAPTYASWYERHACRDQAGRCFDALFDNQLVTVIAEKARYLELKTKLETENRMKRDVYWELKQPVDGRRVFDISTKPNALGLQHAGERKDGGNLNIYPLDGQDIDSKEEMVSNESVRVNGQAVITKRDSITQDFLPPGRYVIGVRYSGVKSWDVKYVYLVVK
jgi:hypothetical protein